MSWTWLCYCLQSHLRLKDLKVKELLTDSYCMNLQRLLDEKRLQITQVRGGKSVWPKSDCGNSRKRRGQKDNHRTSQTLFRGL